MYKKLVIFLVFSFWAPLAAFSADDPSRARLYITVSTGVSFEGCPTCEGKASGYAGHYVFGFGLGLGVSSNKLSVSGNRLWAITPFLQDQCWTSVIRSVVISHSQLV